MQKQDRVQRLREFAQNLKKTDKIVIVHHSDADGLCSALIAAKAIQKIIGKKPEAVLNYDYGNDESNRELLEKIKKIFPSKIVFLDINIDSYPEFLKGLEECSKQLLIIDHHKLIRDYNSKKTVFIKAQFISSMESSAYANAKLAFDLFNNITAIGETAWIACIGIIGDSAEKQWEKFIEQTEKNTGLSRQEMEKIEEMLQAVSIIKPENFPKLFEEFFETKNPRDILKSKHFDLLEEYNSTIQKWLEKFEREKKENKELELVYYTISPEYSIKSPLIDKISHSMPNKTILVFQEYNGKSIGISGRRQDHKIKVNDLLENAVKNIPGSNAGGHIPAAGGNIPKQYFSQFMQNLEKELKLQMQNKKKISG